MSNSPAIFGPIKNASELKRAAHQARENLTLFEQSVKHIKPTAMADPQPVETAQRYLNSILGLDNPTSKASIINAALLQHGKKTANALKKGLQDHWQKTSQALSQYETNKMPENSNPIQQLTNSAYLNK